VQLDTAATPADSIGLIRWSDVDRCAEIVTEGGVTIQLGQEETIYVRNASGVALAEGDAVYVTGATGQRATVAKATANSATAQKTIGLITTTGGIADNGFGFVTIAGLVRTLNTSAYSEGAELWLSPTVAGGLTATQPSAAAQRIVRVGYVVRSHANHGQILVATHYHGTPLANSLMESEGAAAGRTALGLGTLATQSGTFSGTSSGTNTGDQTAATVANTPAGNIAATTVQAALNELDSEKTTAAAALAAADAADIASKAALIEREGMRFDGTAGAVWAPPSVGLGDWSILWATNGASRDSALISFSIDQLVFTTSTTINFRYTLGADATWTVGPAGLFCITKSGSSISLYKNGSLVSTQTLSNSSLGAGSYLGGYNTGGSPALFLNATLSRVSLVNYALTQSEITALIGRGLVTLPEQRGGSMTAVTAGSFVVGKRYRIVTVGTTSFTGIGASANTVGVEFTTTGIGTGTGTSLPLGTLFEQDSGQRNAGYMVRDTSGNGRHLELPETGVSVIDPADTGFIEYTRTTDGYLIGDRRVIPSTGYLVEVVATGNGTVTLGESAGTPANVCASVTLTSTPQILPILVTQTTGGKLYADLGTATTATFKIRLRAV
jgi:hypothetical protein